MEGREEDSDLRSPDSEKGQLNVEPAAVVGGGRSDLCILLTPRPRPHSNLWPPRTHPGPRVPSSRLHPLPPKLLSCVERFRHTRKRQIASLIPKCLLPSAAPCRAGTCIMNRAQAKLTNQGASRVKAAAREEGGSQALGGHTSQNGEDAVRVTVPSRDRGQRQKGAWRTAGAAAVLRT